MGSVKLDNLSKWESVAVDAVVLQVRIRFNLIHEISTIVSVTTVSHHSYCFVCSTKEYIMSVIKTVLRLLYKYNKTRPILAQTYNVQYLIGNTCSR